MRSDLCEFKFKKKHSTPNTIKILFRYVIIRRNNSQSKRNNLKKSKTRHKGD